MSAEQAKQAFLESARNFERLAELAPRVDEAAQHIAERLRAGSKLLLCGNGGSAADAQHIAAELVGRFLVERRPLPAIALTTNTSNLTALGNDYGLEHIFERQVRALATAGDVLIGLSTSGKSDNVVRAMRAARELGVTTIALTGEDPRRMGELGDFALPVPSDRTPRIQEMHIAVGHSLCEIVEAAFADAAQQ